jgi:hypothetical protein
MIVTLDIQIDKTQVAELQARAANNLRAAHGRAEPLRDAILSYLHDGYQLGLSAAELTDFFCVSTPNIVEDAGCMDAGGDAVVALFDELHDQVRQSDG